MQHSKYEVRVLNILEKHWILHRPHVSLIQEQETIPNENSTGNALANALVH